MSNGIEAPRATEAPRARVWAFLSRYLLSGLMVCGALVLRLWLRQWLGDTTPYLLFYPAIMLAARHGGFGPGAFASAMSALVCVYYFLTPGFSWFLTETVDRVTVPIFMSIGLLISWSAESLRRAERHHREAAALALERAKGEHEAAERLALTRDELLQERKRVNDLVGDVPGVVWQAWGDPGSHRGQRMDFVSGYAFRLLGFQPDEWLETPNFWLTLVHPDDRDRAQREAHELYAAGFGGVVEFRWVGRDGRIVWVESHVRTILDAGTPVGMRGVALDMTARKQLEVERADLLAQAQASNRAKDEFLATVSHELRTPINAVLGWTQMLRAGILSPEKIIRALEAIERNAAAQSRMIEDLLDVSRIVAGKFRLELEAVDVGALARLAVDVVRPSAEARRIRLEAALDEGRYVLRADPQRLEQAIWNLLSNAVKFTPPGGRVRITVDGSDDQIVLTVSDTGEGIAPDVLPHIFERFRQGDASTTRAHAGLGIGLALVRHTVELHGGTIRAESGGRGAGATFRMSLPTAGAAAARRSTGASAQAT
jgi:PAS domain S-box-containing protein